VRRSKSRHVDHEGSTAPFSPANYHLTLLIRQPKRFISNLRRSGEWEPDLDIQLSNQTKPD
jgi:hypothetical protein